MPVDVVRNFGASAPMALADGGGPREAGDASSVASVPADGLPAGAGAADAVTSDAIPAFDNLVVAIDGSTLAAAAAAVPSAGRVLVTLMPPHLPLRHKATLHRLLTLLAERAPRGHFDFLQFLGAEDDPAARAACTDAGFTPIATLVYMERAPTRPQPEPQTPTGLGLIVYDANTHARFARAILASYENSRDCPALAGLRDIQTVIAAHKGAGEFDPQNWFCLVNLASNTELGVLLLADLPEAGAMELVYVGLTPTARGKRLGDYLLRLAVSRLDLNRHTRMLLAVDAANTPAVGLYHRHGFSEITRKVAMMLDLRR